MREEKLRARVLASALDNFSKSYQEIRARLSSIQGTDRFLFLINQMLLAGSSATDEIFLDSYYFGDRSNKVIANHLADGIRSAITLGAPYPVGLGEGLEWMGQE